MIIRNYSNTLNAERRLICITPCKCNAARGHKTSTFSQPRSGLNSYGVPEIKGVLITPSCAYRLTRGYQYSSPADFTC